jgi:predicted nucleic acid-binding protein
VRIPEHSFYVGPIVVRECGSLYGAVLRKHAENATVFEVPEDDIPGARYLELLRSYRLGEGETECLAICEHRQYRLVSDDAAARRAGIELLGDQGVTGSLGLLRGAVIAGLLLQQDAFSRYERMVDNGAFLPKIEPDFFKQG